MGTQCNSPFHLAVNRDAHNPSPLVPPAPEPDKPKQDSTSNFANLEAGITDGIKPFRCCINAERLNHLRKKVEDAIRERRTFTIKGGFQYVRNALLSRGWVEKIEFKTQNKNHCTTSNPPTMDEVCCNLPPKLDWESTAAHLAKCEKMIISRLLLHHEVDFYWNMRKDSNEWQHRLNKNKIINRFSRSLFTSKEGLCLLLQQMYWHTEPGVAFVRFPRCYTINFADQCTAFIEDFRLTACISLLKWFTQKMHKDGEFMVCTDDGKVPVTAIQFALDRCNEFIAVQKHVDLDKEFHKVWDHEWEQFLTNFHLVVHMGEKFEGNSCYSLFAFENSAKSTLKNIIPFWPQIEIDGVKNIWIMKPGNKCRGRDITLIKDVNDVIRVMNHKLKYVVQKYVERPLLIYKTKFDIRQWFILTSVQPLTIWMYRDCYLRFSTQKFSLDDFHESVHLTNHAVQHKYTNQDRDKSLPDDNMWDNHTFKAYLRQIGQTEKWFKVIYPGMKECIIGAMLASQDTMDRRPNTFELYGADFMIAENFTPWLIEINACPAMGPTTSVTARMCPQCFDDMVKVVVDRRRDPKAETGLFEMIYRQNLPHTPAYLGMTLSIHGKKIFKKKSASSKKHEKKEEAVEQKQIMRKPVKQPKIQVELIKNYSGPVIGNLIEELHESLFNNTVEGMEEREPNLAPVAPPKSPRRHQRVPLLQPVTQKATVSFSLKQRTNVRYVFSGRKSKGAKESSKALKKRKQKAPPTCKNAPIHCLGLYNKWKQEESVLPTKSSGSNTWEEETASILKTKPDIFNPSTASNIPPKTKSDFAKKPLSIDLKLADSISSDAILKAKPEFLSISLKPEESGNSDLKTAKSIVSPYYISSIARILPDIDRKSCSAENFCHNLLTVGLGYKNNCLKQIVKENILLPLGTQPTVDGCCVKL